MDLLTIYFVSAGGIVLVAGVYFERAGVASPPPLTVRRQP